MPRTFKLPSPPGRKKKRKLLRHPQPCTYGSPYMCAYDIWTHTWSATHMRVHMAFAHPHGCKKSYEVYILIHVGSGSSTTYIRTCSAVFTWMSICKGLNSDKGSESHDRNSKWMQFVCCLFLNRGVLQLLKCLPRQPINLLFQALISPQDLCLLSLPILGSILFDQIIRQRPSVRDHSCSLFVQSFRCQIFLESWP